MIWFLTYPLASFPRNSIRRIGFGQQAKALLAMEASGEESIPKLYVQVASRVVIIGFCNHTIHLKGITLRS